ncbi:MAG: ribonuclease P protein subunit [Candidatus ainarchaeum sp.]|nr:ribonuclease P protein subunit [Candidatus ainarchaeum sp.]
MVKEKKYEINNKNILVHEMIGMNVKVIESSDKQRIGVKGKIIDETKNTFILEGKKIIPKKECVFEFDIGEKVIVNGKDILKRPEERLK